MSQVVSLEQLIRKLNLFLIFFTPIIIVCGFLLVLITLTLLTFLLFPIELLIALLKILCKINCTL